MLRGQWNNQTDVKKWDNYQRYVRQLEPRIASVLKLNKMHNYGCILVDSKAIQTLNRTYRNKDQSTDVISFAALDAPYPSGDCELELGDVFINVQAVVEQAHMYHHSLKREFSFLLTHGILHLFQYDHQTLEDEEKMNRLQDEILKGWADRKFHE